MVRASTLLLALAAAIGANAFIVTAPAAPVHRQRVAVPLQMGLFDAFKKGFENEKLESPAPNAGLKNVRGGLGVWDGVGVLFGFGRGRMVAGWGTIGSTHACLPGYLSSVPPTKLTRPHSPQPARRRRW